MPATSPRTGFRTVAATLALLVAASAAPSPVFPVYEELWGVGPAAVTVVFAVYAGVLLLALLTVGSLSDHLGRRRVVLVALLGVVASMLLFHEADSVGVLVAGRALQGFSTGTALGALGAWLLDLAGPERARGAQLVNGTMPTLGLTAGGLGSGILVQHAPDPTGLVYAVLAVLLLLATAGVALTPDTADRVPGAAASLRPSVRVPAASRAAFLTCAPGFVGSWGLGGLSLGLGPSLVAGVLGIADHAVGGVVVATVSGVGAVTGLLTRDAAPRRVVALGMACLVAGPLLLAAGLTTTSVALFFAGAAVSGVGFGAGFQGALRGVLGTAPAHERAGLLSAVYVLSYLAFGVPAVVAGFLAPHLGLARVADGYALLVVAVGVAGLVLGGVRRADRPAARVPVQHRRTAREQAPAGCPEDREP